MTLLLLPLIAGLAAGDSLPRPPAFPLPAAAAGAEGAMVVVHRQPAIPLVSLRMAILAVDPPGYAGAGHLVQHLLEPTLRYQVSLVGGQVQLQRTSDAVVYTVTGPATELGYLAGVLRSTLQPPQASEAAMLRASRELAEERMAEWEAADQHARSALRARLFPEDLSAAGTEGDASRLREAGAVRRAWAQLYRPDRVVITAVGDVGVAEVERAFSGLPPAETSPSVSRLHDVPDPAPLAEAEATQGWTALGYSGSDLEPAALSVAARLVRDQLRAQFERATVEAEHWWTHHGQALVVLVSVPGAELPAARRALGTAVARTEASLTPSQVYEAARAIRREMLFYARTPDRMAEVLGQFTDRHGNPDAAQRYYAELERVGEEEVREALTALLGRTPTRVEIPPQRLIRR